MPLVTEMYPGDSCIAALCRRLKYMMSEIGAVATVAYFYPCGWGSIPSNFYSFF